MVLMACLISAADADEKRGPCNDFEVAPFRSRTRPPRAVLERTRAMRTDVHHDDDPAIFLRSLGWIALTSFATGFGGYLLFGMGLTG